MPNYFKPLRRKIGVVTMGIASVLMVGWVRGYYFRDQIMIDLTGHSGAYVTCSARGIGWINYESLRTDVDPGFFGIRYRETWLTEPADDPPRFQMLFDYGDANHNASRWKCCGFEFATTVRDQVTGFQMSIGFIPYWSIIIPLTLLSAWLLLSRPRAKKPMPPATENAR